MTVRTTRVTTATEKEQPNMLRRSFLSRAPIGFIGLGEMGKRMAPNLFKDADNTELFVYDLSHDAMKAVEKTAADAGFAGKVRLCKTAADVARNCKIVVTMLPNASIVKNVYTTDSSAQPSLFSVAQPGTIFIDSSTIDPQTPKDLCALARAKSCLFFDAPVSGGVNGAAAGTLTFMIGAGHPEACEADFVQAKKILTPMAKNTILCGAVGSGQVVKICNNLILGQAMIAVSEAMVLGTRLGVDAKTLAGVINTSTGNCWSSNAYNPYPGVMENVPSSRGYTGGFGSALMLKDLGLSLEAAKSANLVVRGAQTAQAVYTDMCASKMDQLDFSGVLKYIDETSKK